MTPKKGQTWLFNAEPSANTPHSGTRVKVLRTVTDPNKELVFVEVLENTQGRTEGERYFVHVRNLTSTSHFETLLAGAQAAQAAQEQSRAARAVLWRALTRARIPRLHTVNSPESISFSLKADTLGELQESVAILAVVLQEFVV